MRLLTILLLLFFLIETTSGQKTDSSFFRQFTIDTSLGTRLSKANSISKFRHVMIEDAFWLLITKKDLKDIFGNIDPIIFFDTTQFLTNVVCDCMIKKDTIYVQGGIAYEAGAGFDLKIVGNLFNGRIWVYGKRYWTDDSLNIKDEILLNSVHQSLKIQNSKLLKGGKKLIGELFLVSEDFFKESDKTPNKFYLKLLFGCKLREVIAF
jgi:hypothetical protein